MNDNPPDEVSNHIIQLLSKTPKFDIIKGEELKEFIKVGQPRDYNIGDTIIKEGDYDDWFHILISGRLVVLKNGKVLSHIHRTGDIIGEMGVIDGSQRSATIKAASSTTLIGFDASLIDQKLKSNDVTFCYVLYRLFSEVLAARLREVSNENINLHKAILRGGN